jgi:5'-deoxynucleotidase YfbR-like HD superfamily hydrolase
MCTHFKIVFLACWPLCVDFPKMQNLDRDKCIRLAIVHDLAECLVGDITPFDGISKEGHYIVIHRLSIRFRRFCII